MRTALVGGGAGGIGSAVAGALRASGHRVILAGRTAESLRVAAARLDQQSRQAADGRPDDGPHGGQDRRDRVDYVDYVVCDLADAEAASRAVEEVEDRHGSLDVLVVNAGGPPPGGVLTVSPDQWRAAVELLLLGPLAMMRTALPRMAGRGFGRVVLVTSTAVRQPQPELAVSTVLRSAATAAAKLASQEFAAQGVTVNCVAPGATLTARRTQILAARAAAAGTDADAAAAEDRRLIPVGRPAEPREIAAAVAFLASGAASYVNGTTLTVDGGRTETV